MEAAVLHGPYISSGVGTGATEHSYLSPESWPLGLYPACFSRLFHHHRFEANPMGGTDASVSHRLIPCAQALCSPKAPTFSDMETRVYNHQALPPCQALPLVHFGLHASPVKLPSQTLHMTNLETKAERRGHLAGCQPVRRPQCSKPSAPWSAGAYMPGVEEGEAESWAQNPSRARVQDGVSLPTSPGASQVGSAEVCLNI